MMQIIVFATLFGIASLHMEPHRQETMLDFFTAVTNAMLKMAEWVIKLTSYRCLEFNLLCSGRSGHRCNP